MSPQIFGLVKYCAGEYLRDKRLGRRKVQHLGGFSFRQLLCCGKQKITRHGFEPQGAPCIVEERRQYTAYLDTTENVVSCVPELSVEFCEINSKG